MAIQLDREHFRDQYIMALQQMMSLLKGTTSDDGAIKGDTAHFYISAETEEMVTRAVDGSIPSANPEDTRVSIDLVEKFLKETITSGQAQTTQVDLLNSIVKRSRAKVEKTYDRTILTALDATTNQYNSGTAVVMSEGHAVEVLTDLLENTFDNGSEIFAAWSPKAWGHLMQQPGVTSVDYVGDYKVKKGDRVFEWMGVTHMMHPNVVGKGTAAAKCFMWDKSCVGHIAAANMDETLVSKWDEDFRMYVSSRLMHGAKVLQAGGVWEIVHDDTAAIAD